MIDRRYLRYFDWASFGLIITLLGIGLLFVFSATSKEYIFLSPFFKKQIFGATTGKTIYFGNSSVPDNISLRFDTDSQFVITGAGTLTNQNV